MKIADKIWTVLCVLLLVLFLPVLICVGFIGNRMKYWDYVKLLTRLPNPVLLVIALAGLVFCIFLFRNFFLKEMTRKLNWITNAALALLCIGLYFLNLWISKEICFNLPWDVMVVRGAAKEYALGNRMGYIDYFSIYSNNLPIVYILGRIFRKGMEMPNYHHVPEFLWIQTGCFLVTAACFFGCLTVKKLTRRILPAIVSFLLCTVLVGFSSWKTVPYTDTYGLIFPILCVYLYVCYRQAKYAWSKWLLILSSLAAGMIGGFVKPNLYIAVLAVLGTECICFLRDYRKKWGFLLAEVLFFLLLMYGGRLGKNYVIEEIGLDFNPQVEASWQHYFLMGLNEETTGGYYSADGAIFGEFQTSKKDRTHAELERAIERIKSRGFLGSILFCLRKMTMTFNDGLFGWKTEVWVHEEFPEDLTSHTAMTQRLRSIFRGNDLGLDVGGYNTFCQLTWIFSLLGIPGICLRGKQDDKGRDLLILLFLGIFFYQMLFEARPRYLFAFLPVLLAASVCGIWEYACRISSFLAKKKAKKAGTPA